MTWEDVFAEANSRIVQRWQLVAAGATKSSIAGAVRNERIVRLRRDYYSLPGTSQPLMEAIRVGGRLGCISALADAGVFAVSDLFTHAHVLPQRSRLRSPRNRFIPLTPHNRDGVELHWKPLLQPDEATIERVGLVDALAEGFLCQQPALALASLDNALHQGLVGADDVAAVFTGLPERLHYLRNLVDGRSESGQETVLRLILVDCGLQFEVQPQIPGVGRVDFLVEGRLILEADSRLAHDGWDAHMRDANRDINAGAQGYLSLRPLYQHTMLEPTLVREAILSTLYQARLGNTRRPRR